MPAFDTKPQVEKSEPAPGSSGSEGPPDDGFGDLSGPAIDRPGEQKSQSDAGVGRPQEPG